MKFWFSCVEKQNSNVEILSYDSRQHFRNWFWM